MGLFDKFLTPPPVTVTPAAPTANTETAQQQAAGQPGNIQPPTNGATPGNGMVTESATQEIPLDEFKDIWETKPTDPNDPSSATPPELKVADVQKAVSNANFANSITPEAVQAIASGGEDAVQIFQQILNSSIREAVAQTTVIANKLSEKNIATALEQQQSKIPQMLREQTTANVLAADNPLFSNPAIKPIAEATKSQLLQKYPDATPDQIATMTRDFLSAMGEAFNPQVDSATAEEDWSKFL